jgi:redox-regulated HSP33 family molecular chaperone
VACALRLVPKEGRLAIVTDVGNGMRWTPMVPLTNGTKADGEVVWS